MKVTATLNQSGYGEGKELTAKGFTLNFGDYSQDYSGRIHLDFADGLELINQLVAAAKQHHDAVQARLVETGNIATYGSIREA